MMMEKKNVVSFDEKDVPDLKNGAASSKNPAESTYKLLLETVWVDDILDPSEVKLLARKRGELGLSFERHFTTSPRYHRGLIDGPYPFRAWTSASVV